MVHMKCCDIMFDSDQDFIKKSVGESKQYYRRQKRELTLLNVLNELFYQSPI